MTGSVGVNDRNQTHVHDARGPDFRDEAGVDVPVDEGPCVDRARLRQRPHDVHAPAVPDACEFVDACRSSLCSG